MTRAMGLARWRALREELVQKIEDTLCGIPEIEYCLNSDLLEASEKARDAVLKSLYECNAIQPPKGIDPS